MTKNKIVLPGDFIGTSEEFTPGENVYEIGGKIYSSVLGKLKIDKEKRVINVEPFKRPPKLKVGDIIIGYVVDVKENVAIVHIEAIEGIVDRGFAGVITLAAIPISQISEEYVKDIKEKIRVGDVVRARVFNIYGGIYLTIKNPDLGVISAYCKECGRELIKVGKDELMCPSCLIKEKRKLSTLYGKYVPRGEYYGNKVREL